MKKIEKFSVSAMRKNINNQASSFRKQNFRRNDEPMPDVYDKDFGLESVLRAHNQQIKTRSDVLICWMHWILLKSGFKCHGGEFQITEIKTEKLPRSFGWNGDKQSYLLKYSYADRFFALGVYVRGSNADISFVTYETSMQVSIPIADLVRDDLSIVSNAVDDYTESMERNVVCPLVEIMRRGLTDSQLPDPCAKYREVEK